MNEYTPKVGMKVVRFDYFGDGFIFGHPLSGDKTYTVTRVERRGAGTPGWLVFLDNNHGHHDALGYEWVTPVAEESKIFKALVEAASRGVQIALDGTVDRDAIHAIANDIYNRISNV